MCFLGTRGTAGVIKRVLSQDCWIEVVFFACRYASGTDFKLRWSIETCVLYIELIGEDWTG